MSAVKLSRENYANLLQSERELLSFSPEFDKLEECGMDCQIFRQLQQEKLGQISALKKNFAPTPMGPQQ